MSARLLLCAALVAFAYTSAQAGEPAYPGETEFTFRGEHWPSQPPLTTLCPANGPCVTSIMHAFEWTAVSTQYQLHRNGSVVRGSIHAQDPFGTARFHVMEFELHTNDFFTRNPNAHIVIAPRTFLPYERPDGYSYNNYPYFNDWAEAPGVKRPAAYGTGLIIGNVSSCAQNTAVPSGYLPGQRTNGVAIEHFLGIGAPGTENKVACPPAQISFDPYSVYAIKVAVKQDLCSPTGTQQCRWVGYSITKVAPAWGVPTPVIGGGEDVFRDNSAPTGGPVFGPTSPRGWSALRSVDRSDWMLSHIFTTPSITVPSAPWSFQVKNLQVSASASAPGWWPGIP